MPGTRAISTTSRRVLSSSFFFLQGKVSKEIHAHSDRNISLFPSLVGLRTYQHPCTSENAGPDREDDDYYYYYYYYYFKCLIGFVFLSDKQPVPHTIKQMLRWFPRFQVATTCFSCSPPDLNSLVTNFMFCLHVK